jgi:hypothetical protein
LLKPLTKPGTNFSEPNASQTAISSILRIVEPQFWQGLHKLKHLFKWGAEYKVKSGDQTLFWEDVWFGSTPLKTQFPDLYKFCDDPETLVADYFGTDGWEIGLRRRLTVGEVEQRNAC